MNDSFMPDLKKADACSVVQNEADEEDHREAGDI